MTRAGVGEVRRVADHRVVDQQLLGQGLAGLGEGAGQLAHRVDDGRDVLGAEVTGVEHLGQDRQGRGKITAGHRFPGQDLPRRVHPVAGVGCGRC